SQDRARRRQRDRRCAHDERGRGSPAPRRHPPRLIRTDVHARWPIARPGWSASGLSGSARCGALGVSETAPGWREIVADVWVEGQRLSAVGPGDVTVHLAHAEHLAGLLEVPARAVDLGSGAGIPGLALAGLWPASEWVLLDAAQRRTRLLERAVERLGWTGRVHVVHGRAEDLGRDPQHRQRYDLVTARLFGPPAAAAECGAPLLRADGILAVTEPPDPPPG